MALASIIFGGNNRTELRAPGTGKAVLTIDCTLRSAHSLDAQITQRELEDGSVVNDHMVVGPEQVVMEGVISETPLDLFSGLAASGVGAAASLLSQRRGLGAAAATGLLGGKLLGSINGNRTVNSFDLMIQLQKKRILFDLVTGLRNYKNMMLTSIVANRSSTIGQSIEFTATIKQITFVKSALVPLGENGVLGDIGSSAASETNLGKQAASTAGDDTSSNGSIAVNLWDGLIN